MGGETIMQTKFKKWLVPILCGLPIIGFILWMIAGKNPGNLLTLGLILACPLSHIFLMKHDGHGRDKHDHKDRS